MTRVVPSAADPSGADPSYADASAADPSIAGLSVADRASPADADATSTFVRRRRRLAEAMAAAGGGIALLPTALERLRSGDTEHAYRVDSSFHHLTGFGEPGAWLLLGSDGRSTLVCRPKDLAAETWDGHRLGVDAAPAVLGVDDAVPAEHLDRELAQRLAGQAAVWFPLDHPSDVAARVDRALAAIRGDVRSGARAPGALRDLSPLIDEMRLVKDDGELAIMRRAGVITAGAHVRAMRFCAGRFRAGAAGVHEYEIEAELLHEFRRHGAEAPAYPSIVAAGANACVLHHPAGTARLLRGELCLVDAGCELDGYASDVTRTFPADGRFSAAQRDIYDLVLAAQQAAVTSTRPGCRQRDAHSAAVRVLSEGMLALGLLDRDVVGDVENVIATAAYRRFYMHGTGHWLGRDVHDVGDYLSADEAPVEQPDGQGGRVVRRPSRRLQPGMVVTLEPGLYIRPAADVPERYWNIGVRIEDDAVVTPGGCELISRGVPVEADEIERLMLD